MASVKSLNDSHAETFTFTVVYGGTAVSGGFECAP